MRIQLNINNILESELTKEANKKKVAVNVLVYDILLKHYNLTSSNQLSSVEIRKKIFSEIGEFVKQVDSDIEFDLNMASETYSNISMVYNEKPNTLKAQIGREFNNYYVGKIKPFLNVKQVKLPNGNPKKSSRNRAALYSVKK